MSVDRSIQWVFGSDLIAREFSLRVKAFHYVILLRFLYHHLFFVNREFMWMSEILPRNVYEIALWLAETQWFAAFRTWFILFAVCTLVAHNCLLTSPHSPYSMYMPQWVAYKRIRWKVKSKNQLNRLCENILFPFTISLNFLSGTYYKRTFSLARISTETIWRYLHFTALIENANAKQ